MGWKLLLFDLDGTLLDSSRSIRQSTLTLLTQLMAQGVQVGFATGRALRSALPYAEQLRPNGPLILFNGGLVWDPLAKRPIFERRLPRADAHAALSIAAELNIHANLYLDDEIAISHPSPTSLQSEVKDGVPHTIVGDLVAYCAGDPYKVLLIDEQARFEEFKRRFRAVAGSPCTLVHSEPTYLEVLPAGVCKGAALPPIEAHTGIAANQVMAFGDGLNDIELLTACGCGVAMGNALEAVKQCADAIIGDCDTDAIERYLRSQDGLPTTQHSL
jgi:Cof subfamily protein (haloacid dehalogenase superfamily)